MVRLLWIYAISSLICSIPAAFERRERGQARWIIGLLIVAGVGAIGIGAPFLLLRKAIGLETARSAWDAGLNQRSQIEKDMDARRQESRSSLTKISAEIKEAEQLLAGKQDAVADLNAARALLDATTSDLDQASAELTRAEATTRSRQTEWADLEKQIAEAKGLTSALAKKRTTLLEEIAEKQIELMDLKASVASVSQVKAEKDLLDVALARLKKEQQDYTVAQGELQVAVDALRKTAATLRAEREALTSDINQRKAEFLDTSEGLARIRSEKTTFDAAMAKLRTEQVSLQKEIQTSQEEATRAQAAAKGAVDNLNSLKDEQTKLAADITQRRSDSSETAEALAGLRIRKANLEDSVAKLTAEKASLEAQIDQSQTDEEQAKTSAKAAVDSLNSLLKRVSDNARIRTDLEQTKEDLEKRLHVKRKELEVTEGELKVKLERRQQLEGVEAEVGQKQAEYKVLHEALLKAKAERAALNAQIAVLTEEKATLEKLLLESRPTLKELQAMKTQNDKSDAVQATVKPNGPGAQDVDQETSDSKEPSADVSGKAEGTE